MEYQDRYRRGTWWFLIGLCVLDLLSPFFPIVGTILLLGLFIPPLGHRVVRTVNNGLQGEDRSVVR